MTRRTLPAIVWTVVIVVICLTPASWLGSGGGGDGPSFLDRLLGPIFGSLPYDKAIHFGIFFVFGLLWHGAGASIRATFLGGLALAIGTELGQSIPVLERTTDLDDLIANVSGIVAAFILVWLGKPRTTHLAPDPNP
ncbi:VanZ family protein [Tautonia rosea]|uniref:VanZ family protein n=1 Tax=Tautonia rosea TaxID=2728037 RepID=UPI001475F2DF|nr:VanZ family protein [Tautonia rosea]